MKRAALCLLLGAASAFAHVVSMSSGELRLNGSTAVYELRIPLYEVKDILNPQQKLFDAIQFEGGGSTGRLLNHECRNDDADLVCTGNYLFNLDVKDLKIVCRFAAVTVPNHVHIFRAVKATGESEQAFFDLAFTETEMRFRAPTTAERFLKGYVEGIRRGLTALTTLLFLFGIAVAARSNREYWLLTLALLAVESAVLLGPAMRLSPKFLEAAAALTTAYLAVEVLVLPKAGQRWLVVAVLGAFHGLFFRLFLSGAEGGETGFVAGLISIELAMAGVTALIRTGARRLVSNSSIQWTRILAGALFCIGTIWFLVRTIM